MGLSDRIQEIKNNNWSYEEQLFKIDEAIKEAVKKLKKELKSQADEDWDMDLIRIIDEINKIFGDKFK